MTTVAAVAAAIWWYAQRPRTPALATAWSATVAVLAGDGVPVWRDGAAPRARFSEPFAVAVRPDGTVYVTDAGDAHRVRAIAPDGTVFTLAGSGRGFADGPGTLARFDTPSGLAIDASGNLYVADTGNNAVRLITPDGHVSTLAGGGVAGYVDAPGRHARFNGPVGIATDGAGGVVVADTYNDRIRRVRPDGSVSTVAGAGPGAADGAADLARFDTPCGVAVDAEGNIWVADTGNDAIRIIDRHGLVSTVPAAMALGLRRPIGIGAGPGGEIFVTDEGGRTVEIAPTGAARVLAGSLPGYVDGAGARARFRRPTGIAFASPGRLVVADSGNALVRLVSAVPRTDLALPSSPLIAPQFDAVAFGRYPLLWPVFPMEGPHELAGTIGEARGGEGAERFHAGIDVRMHEGAPVLAVRDGVVSSPLAVDDVGTLNESLRIGPLTYVHIRAGRRRTGEALDTTRFVQTVDADGVPLRVRVRRGARFRTGEPIGTVNAFNHVHLNVGWRGEEHNPLQFRLAGFEDAIPPTIARGGIRLFDEVANPLTRRRRGRVLVSGRVQIVVDAWDQADGNRANRRLGLHQLGYQVLLADGSPAPGFEEVRHTLRFDRLRPDPAAARLVYAHGSGIPFYGRRTTRFLYIVTNTFRDGVAAQGFWDTALLPPADYILRVHASDANGNVAEANRDLPITVLPAGSPD